MREGGLWLTETKRDLCVLLQCCYSVLSITVCDNHIMCTTGHAGAEYGGGDFEVECINERHD